jgi:predicted alpha/beta hydrolase family esterase
MPMMPNKQRAIYHEWKSLFEQLIQQLSEKHNITLIGNSLGGCFLLKYFSEIGNWDYQIESIHLTAACISEGDFTPPTNYEYLQHM